MHWLLKIAVPLPFSTPFKERNYTPRGAREIDRMMTLETADAESRDNPEYEGAGEMGVAGRLPNGHVIKYTDAKSEADNAKYLIKHPEPCFPKIFDEVKKVQKYPVELWRIEMEFARTLNDLESFIFDSYYLGGQSLEQIRNYIVKNQKDLLSAGKAVQVFNALKAFTQCHARSAISPSDVHTENIGWIGKRLVMFGLGS